MSNLPPPSEIATDPHDYVAAIILMQSSCPSASGLGDNPSSRLVRLSSSSRSVSVRNSRSPGACATLSSASNRCIAAFRDAMQGGMCTIVR